VPAVAVIVVGGPEFGKHSGVVAVARGGLGIPVEVTKLSPVYNLFSFSRSFFLVFLCTHFHKGGHRVGIAASRK
jgi:hypothetical protein